MFGHSVREGKIGSHMAQFSRREQHMFEGWSRRSGAAPAACWVTAHAVKFSNSQPRSKIVRFSKLPSWVTAPLAPGGAGRQRERLLWSCCDQGSAPAAGWLWSWRPRPGGVVRLECCRAGAAPPSSGGSQGARARHLLLLKACCLRNNRCTQVGRQGQRTRSTLS